MQKIELSKTEIDYLKQAILPIIGSFLFNVSQKDIRKVEKERLEAHIEVLQGVMEKLNAVRNLP